MMNAHILAAIDLEIEHLQQARAILLGNVPSHKPAKKSLGRPKKNAEVKLAKRVMSEAGRKAIAAAQKKRWAAKKAAAKK